MPRIGGHWGDCDPKNPKNRRNRCSVLVEQTKDDGTTQVLIDTTPDLRHQLLGANVGRLDGVVYTHAHADHLHGIDDLRMIVINTHEMLNVWAHTETNTDIQNRFGYAFETPPGSSYPPILKMNIFDGPFSVSGPGGDIEFHPFRVDHGAMPTWGLRIGDCVYLPDVATIPTDSRAALSEMDTFIIDALRRTPHPTHAHLDQALDWISEFKPKRAVLTNMHIDLDYDTLCGELPQGVVPAFDGLKLDI